MPGNYALIELVSFVNPFRKDLIEILKCKLSVPEVLVSQPQFNRCRCAGRDREFVVRRGLSPAGFGIHSSTVSVNHIFIDTVLNVVCSVCEIEQALRVCVVFSEEQFMRIDTVKPPVTKSM